MAEVVDVYWSFRSPYSHLVTPDLLRLSAEYDVDLQLRVVLPIAVRMKEAVFDADAARRVAYILRDAFRQGEMLGIPTTIPQPDPLVQDMETFVVADEQPLIYDLCKLGVEANRRNAGVAFAHNVTSLIFGGVQGWNEGDHLAQAAAQAGLDLADMRRAIADGDQFQEVEQNQRDLDAVGHWGVPTMVVKGEPFFGHDRMDTLRWRLDQYGLKKARAS